MIIYLIIICMVFFFNSKIYNVVFKQIDWHLIIKLNSAILFNVFKNKIFTLSIVILNRHFSRKFRARRLTYRLCSWHFQRLFSRQPENQERWIRVVLKFVIIWMVAKRPYTLTPRRRVLTLLRRDRNIVRP